VYTLNRLSSGWVRCAYALVACLFLAGCFESKDGASAWISGTTTVHQVSLPDGAEVFRQPYDGEPLIAADSVNRIMWFLAENGEITRHNTTTNETGLFLTLPRRGRYTTQYIVANSSTGGLWVYHRRHLYHITADGNIEARRRLDLIDIAYNPSRDALWTTDQSTIRVLDDALETVAEHKFRRPQGNPIIALAVEPTEGGVVVLRRRSLHHLGSNAKPITRWSAQNQMSLAVSRSGQVFTSKGNALTAYDLTGEQLFRLRTPSRKRINDIATDWQSGELWVLAKRRLYKIDDDKLEEVYPVRTGRRIPRWLRQTEFKQLELLGDAAVEPAITFEEPEENELVEREVEIEAEVNNIWSDNNASRVTLLLNGEPFPADCDIDDDAMSRS